MSKTKLDISEIDNDSLGAIVFELCTNTANVAGCSDVRCKDCPFNSIKQFKEFIHASS